LSESILNTHHAKPMPVNMIATSHKIRPKFAAGLVRRNLIFGHSTRILNNRARIPAIAPTISQFIVIRPVFNVALCVIFGLTGSSSCQTGVTVCSLPRCRSRQTVLMVPLHSLKGRMKWDFHEQFWNRGGSALCISVVSSPSISPLRSGNGPGPRPRPRVLAACSP
jgi:hypothetical protein